MCDLSNIRKRIIQLKINGCQDKVIANELHKSTETIKYHWKWLQKHYGVKTTLQVCVVATQAAANDPEYSPNNINCNKLDRRKAA